jgi:ABC-type sugar transport system substrate-binding protein
VTPPHRKRATRAVSGLAVGALVVVLAACGSSDDSDGSSGDGASQLPKTLVFSPLSLAPPALKGLSEGVKGYAGSQGWDVIVQDPNFDPNKQVQQLKEVLDSRRAGAAWIISVAPPSLKPVLESAKAKGIPLLVNGTPEEYGLSGAQPGITFDAIDYTAEGTAVGEQLGKCVTEKLGGNAKVLFATSAEGTAGKKETEEATLAALKTAAPGATVTTTVIAKDRTQSQTDIGNALQGNPDVKALMALNDEGLLGGLGAFDAAGKDLPCAVDFGGNDEVLGLVKKGDVYASVALQFEADMKQSFDTLVKMQADPTAPGLLLTVPQKIITAEG